MLNSQAFFYLIGQIYTNLDHFAPVDLINVENVTQNFRHSATLRAVPYAIDFKPMVLSL